ncbi:MAG: O-antigen ligase family protein [Nitratireductor sp.]
MAYTQAIEQASYNTPGFMNPHVRKLIANTMIAICTFSSGFVIFEPAPYDLLIILLFATWALLGMKISRYIVPIFFLYTLFNFGGIIATTQMDDFGRGMMYVAVSYFLALSSVFYASIILEDPSRLRIIFRAYVLGAVVTTILGIIGYFGWIGGFERFTRYTRLMGAFQDPNVYAPFIVMPILYLVYGMLNRGGILMLVRAAALLILIFGLFLAFSRAAWGLSLITGGLFYLLLVINEQSAKVRLKYIALGVVGVVSIIILLAVALQFDAVSSLFAERFKVVQDYDGGELGRFARHALGYQMAMELPLGVGPLEFGYMVGEDPHNNFIKALMSHGWIGFVSWVIIMFWTLIAGFKLLFKQRPWLPYYQIAYVVFLGHCVIGNVIDTDHWRHYFFAVGVVWGCIAVEKTNERRLRMEAEQQAA